MRVDGRRADQLRQVKITPDMGAYAEGSVQIVMGETRVLCNATIEEGIPRWMRQAGTAGGWVTAEYAMLPRATQQRSPRETAGVGGRTQEIRRLIGRSLRRAVDLANLGERTCIIDCDVIKADGGTRTAAITGGYVALAMALNKLARQGAIMPGILLEPVAAASVGVVQGIPLLDLCYAEDSAADVDANIVMNAAGKIIEVQVSAERDPISRSTLSELLDLATRGIGELLAVQRAALDQVLIRPS